MRAAVILPGLIALGAAACGDCFTLIVRVNSSVATIGVGGVNPSVATIRVGQRVTLRHEHGFSCGSPLAPGATSWHTADTLIVYLDTLSGDVTGRSPGTAHVTTRDSDIELVIQVQP
jgi:hypothetical protein